MKPLAKHVAMFLMASLLTLPVTTAGQSISDCDYDAVQLRLNCSNRGFKSVPAGMPTDAFYVLLSNNDIQTLQDGAFDGLTQLLVLELDGNDISKIEENVWTPQEERSNTAGEIFPLISIKMDGNPSECSVTRNSTDDSVHVFCDCAVGFQGAAVVAGFGREFCDVSGTPAPAEGPTASNPPTISPTFPPSDAPTISPTLSPTRSLYFEEEGDRGCCVAVGSQLFDWYQYAPLSQTECQNLCDVDVNCRGIEYPWVSVGDDVEQCILLFDAHVAPIDVSFVANATGLADAVGPVVSSTTSCDRLHYTCYRICRPGVPASTSGCTVPTTEAPQSTARVVGGDDRFIITFGIARSGIPLSFATPELDAESSGERSSLETGVAEILCSTRANVLPESGVSDCVENVSVVVLSIATPTGNTAATDINFYVLLNGEVVAGALVDDAFDAYTPDELRGVFLYSVLGYQVEAPVVTTTNVTDLASDGDDDSNGRFITFFTVTVAVVAVLIMLVLAIVYASVRIRTLRAMVAAAVLSRKNGYDVEPLLNPVLDIPQESTSVPSMAMSKFYQEHETTQSPLDHVEGDDDIFFTTNMNTGGSGGVGVFSSHDEARRSVKHGTPQNGESGVSVQVSGTRSGYPQATQISDGMTHDGAGRRLKQQQQSQSLPPLSEKSVDRTTPKSATTTLPEDYIVVADNASQHPQHQDQRPIEEETLEDIMLGGRKPPMDDTTTYASSTYGGSNADVDAFFVGQPEPAAMRGVYSSQHPTVKLAMNEMEADGDLYGADEDAADFYTMSLAHGSDAPRW